MIFEITQDYELKLYDYFNSFYKNTPYYFPASFDYWRKCMFNDCNYDDKPLFTELYTYAIERKGIINGFIQFGLTSFVFDEKGSYDYSRSYGVIRNFHYEQNEENAQLLLDKATEYFEKMRIRERYAFFHFFGMSCHARQGKLHESAFYMEEMLCKYGYKKEHENVYFSKSLHQAAPIAPTDISFSYSKDGCSIDFIKENVKIGGCGLYFIPNSSICFLKWIYLDKKYSHQGLGTKCMNKLFYELQQTGIFQLDTDTTDSNINAQTYYLKTGFENKGIMRSYNNM